MSREASDCEVVPPSDPDEAGHEARCRQCGRCCCAKLIIGDEVVYTAKVCKHLDPATKLCRVYERRHEVNPGCLNVEEGIKLGVFPADCPYVQGIEGYRPPRERWTEDEADLYGGYVGEYPDHGGGGETGEK